MQYIDKAIHFLVSNNFVLGLSAACFTLLSYLRFDVIPNYYLVAFIFLSTIFVYTLLKNSKQILKFSHTKHLDILMLKIIALLIFIVAISFKIQVIQKVLFLLLLMPTLGYGFSFFGMKKLRDFPFTKIFIVATIWSLVTGFIPLLDYPLTTQIAVYVLSRVLLLLAVMLIFEIVDVPFDIKNKTQTVPQTIGIKKTKLLAFVLLFVQYLLQLLGIGFSIQELVFSLGILLFLVFANESRNQKYSSLWLESLPVFCYCFSVCLENWL